MPKIKENEGLRGDVLEYVAQESPQFDVEIGQKNHFRMETNQASGSPGCLWLSPLACINTRRENEFINWYNLSSYESKS